MCCYSTRFILNPKFHLASLCFGLIAVLEFPVSRKKQEHSTDHSVVGQKRKWINVIHQPPNVNSLCLHLTISSVSIRITTQLGITSKGFKKLLIFCTRRQVLWNYPSILACTETWLTDAGSSVCLILWFGGVFLHSGTKHMLLTCTKNIVFCLVYLQ